MTNDVEKYSDICVEDVPRAEGKVFVSEDKEEREKFLNDMQGKYSALLENLQKIKNDVKPLYELQHDDAKKFEIVGNELSNFNQEIWELENILKQSKTKFINSKIKIFLAKVVSSCVFVPFGFVLLNKIIGNPAVSNFSDFIQYLIGLPVSITVTGILVTYPFFQKIINKYENVFKKTDEFKNISSSIYDKELLRDVKEKEYNKIKSELSNRNKIIEKYEDRMRVINCQMKTIENDVLSKLFNISNNEELGISIEDFGTHHVLSMKI